MEIGRFHIEQLSEGQFSVYKDGTINRITPEEADSDREIHGSAQQPGKVGIDPILISGGEHHILLDTGLGWGLDAGSDYRDVSNIRTNLNIFDREPEDITHVILSHLHYDHMAGCSYTDDNSATRATFPNAVYYVQKREWEYGISLVEGDKEQPYGPKYNLDEFYRLVADERVVFIEDDKVELIPGITIIWTGGHTPGHQAVAIRDGDQAAYYLGDLLPNENHLNKYSMRGLDLYPVQAKKMKTRLMRQAFDENAYLLFYHSLYSKLGRLVKDKDKNFVLKT